MTLSKREFLGQTAALALATTLPAAAQAQTFPSKPIRLIVPRAPGGGTDILSRLLAPGLQKRLGQPIIVENKPDATAVVGSELVKRAEPDGYMLLVADNALYQNPAIIDQLPYDTLQDFAAVTMLAQSPVILVAHPSLPAANTKELIAHAKANPKKVSFASGGIGSSTHFSGVMFNLKAGTDLLHVPFKSSGEAMNSLLGGHVNMQFGGISSARAHVEEGKLRAIGVTGVRRDPSMPNVPTLAEDGLPGVDVTSVWGVHAPAKTPGALRQQLRDAFVAAMQEPETAKKLADLGFQVIGNTPDEHQKQTNELVAQWLDVGKKVNLRE
jgi:tripartite-type tricarboxylate transporter receptor subunit TctC